MSQVATRLEVQICRRCGHTRDDHRNGSASVLSPKVNTTRLPNKTASLYECLEAGGFKDGP